MLFKQNDRPAIKGIILTSLLSLLAGCGNSEAIESLVSADPELKNRAQQAQNKSRSLQEVSPTSEGQDSVARQTEPSVEDKPEATGDNIDSTQQNEAVDERDLEPEDSEVVSQVSNLPFSFPGSFPIYPQAELEEIKSQGDSSGTLVWNTTDNRKAVADYYQAELTANDWDIIKPFTINPQRELARAIAVKNELRIELTLLPPTTEEESEGKNTKLAVVYHPIDEPIPQSSIVREFDSAEPESDSESPSQPANSQTEASETKADRSIPENYLNSSEEDFDDLDEVPEQLQQPLASVSALGILTPYTGDANVELTKFAPNQAITRAEYARWLIAANNRYYNDNPGKKIYVATKNTEPAFKDVSPSHPDFAAIQSLAEAGLIPSRLTEDSTNLLFRPDAPLIREDLVTWKVPLDTRQSLPKASIEAVEESWGFQDVASIDSSAVRALYADFQNGDRSNIRRVFGYTTLFQPKKPVTRAEAAASLGYFGFQGDGITAQEVLETETEVGDPEVDLN